MYKLSSPKTVVILESTSLVTSKIPDFHLEYLHPLVRDSLLLPFLSIFILTAF